MSLADIIVWFSVCVCLDVYVGAGIGDNKKVLEDMIFMSKTYDFYFFSGYLNICICIKQSY